MAEALADEINHPAAGLVSRDHLDFRMAELQGRIDSRFAEFESRIVGLEGRMDSRFAEMQGHIDRQIAELRAWAERRFAEQGTSLTWRMLGMLGGQLVLIGALIRLLGPG